MPEIFNVGEQVTLVSGRRATVEFGPFTSGGSRRSDTYLVKIQEGPETGANVTALSTSMKRGPKFTVGDAVRISPLDTPAKVVAGPFTARLGSTRYVVKYDGTETHGWHPETSLTKVENPRLTYRRDGIAWDLASKYTDRDGDRWEFTGAWERGEPLMSCDVVPGSRYRNRLMTDVLESFGPLTKVED